MKLAAEILRYLLIAEQIALILWMLTSDLWRRLPLWTLWITVECVSRIPFTAGGWYWQTIWRPLQPALLFLLSAAAIEARYHAGESSYAIASAALLVAPIGVGLHLGEIIQLRIGLCAGVACLLYACAGTSTARWHARLLAGLCTATALAGWQPATGTQWWMMRCGYLAVYCAACAGWIWLLTRSAAEPATIA